MKSNPVTIVVLSKYVSVFADFYESANKFCPDHQVVVVCDGPEVWDWLQARHEVTATIQSRWAWIRGPEQFTMAGNGNLGLRAAPSNSDVLYCGDDVRFLESGTVETLQKVANFSPKIGILSPRLMGRASPALGLPPESSSFAWVRPLEMWFPCVYIKREVIDKIGYLDERFNQFGGDDLDYNIRAQQAGYRLAVTARATVHHLADPSGGPTTFVKNLGVEEFERQQARAWPKLMDKYNVQAEVFELFLQTNDMRLLDPSAVPVAPPSSPPVGSGTIPAPAPALDPLAIPTGDDPSTLPDSPADMTRKLTPNSEPIRMKSLQGVDVTGQGTRGLAGKSIFVMLPMYGGQCTMNFFIAFQGLVELCRKYAIQMEYMVLHNESLITRGRNRLIDYWMKKSKASHGLFWDVDIGLDPKDVLVALDLDLDVAGFACVKKSIRWDRVQDLLHKNGRKYTPEEMVKVSGDFILNFDAFTGRKVFNLGEPQAAHSVGTGVMLISRRVIHGLESYYPDNYYIGSRTDPAALEGKIYDHFQVGVNPETKDYDSEDYRFCINARKAGFKVWIIPWAQTTHAGTYIFTGDLPAMSALMPEWAR